MTIFIHMSDFHFCENDLISKHKLDSITSSILKHRPDKVILLFGGDLAQSGSIKEYEAFEIFYNSLISNIENKIHSKVLSFFTPGNHDLKYLPNEKRTRSDILKLNQDDLMQQFNDEVKRVKSYEELVEKIYLSQMDGSIEELKNEEQHFYRHFQVLVENDILVDIFCLNNALFSFYDKEDKVFDNDSGALRLPIDKVRYILKKGNIGFLLMHFPLEFFEYNSKNKLQYKIDRHFNFVLTGHIHNEESNQSIHSSKKVMNIKTGFFMKKNSAESTFKILKLSNNHLSIFNYLWNDKHDFYEEKLIHEGKIETRNISIQGLSFKDEFINDFYYDPINLKNSILDCFIFPNIISTNIYNEDEQEKIDDFESLMDVVYYHDKVVIEGDDGSGKSTLLKHIFKVLSKDHLVLYIDDSLMLKNRSGSKIIQELFLNQYDAVSIDQFYNYDVSKRVLFVDNVENNKKALESIRKEFSKTVMTTPRNYKKSIIDLIKNELDDEENGIVLEIKGFYKSKRTELATKLYTNLHEKSGHKVNNRNIKKFELKFTNIVDTHLTIFGVNPFMINLLVQHLYENQTAEEKNIYNDVFHSNLTRTIRNSADFYESREYNSIVTALQKVSFFMHQKNISIIEEVDITKIISDYNKKFRQKVKSRIFIDVLIHAKVLKEKDVNSYYFSSKNYFAYYVSKEFIYLMNKKELDDPIFLNLFENIFNNVNDKILLFIAFAQQNDRIINHIASKAVVSFGDLKEIEIDKLKILSKSAKDYSDLKLIGDDERKKHISNVEKNEEKTIEKERDSVVDMFGYNYSEFEMSFSTFDNYIKLLCTILPNFTHMLEEQDQEKIAMLIYKLPNQFLYWIFKDIDEKVDEIYDLLKKAVIKSGKATEDDIDKIASEIMTLFQQLISHAIVSVYDEVAKISMDYTTEELLADYNRDMNLTQRVQKIIFNSHTIADNEYSKFKKNVTKEFDKAQKDKNIVIKNILKIVVNNFLLENDPFIDYHGENQRFLTTFYGKDALTKYLSNKKEK